ncbi:MAG: hypothetical protein ACOH2M_29700 [Cypionkella sp.]
MPKLVAVNAHGLRIGEDHPRAKLTDGEVELVRQLNEGGMGYGTIALKFEVSKSAVAWICRYERRGQTVAKWKKVPEITGLKKNRKEVHMPSFPPVVGAVGTDSSGPMLGQQVGDLSGEVKSRIRESYKKRGVDDPTDAQIMNVY